MKKVLSIAGSDCSGGAGVQADLKTFSAHGVFGMSVIVSVVAENTSRVIDIQDITPDMIEKQIDAVFEDIEVDAVKIGMLSQPGCMETVATKLRQYTPKNIIIDPVMYAKNGCPLMNPASIETLIKTIIPLGDLLTPNIPEAEKIAGIKIVNIGDMEKAAIQIYQMGCKNVLVKGGHAIGDAIDILFDGNEFHRFSAERINTKNTHGTGCTYSSAIAANLALGLDMREAVKQAKEYVTTAIRHSLSIGKGHGPTHHFYELYKNGLKGIEIGQALPTFSSENMGSHGRGSQLCLMNNIISNASGLIKNIRELKPLVHHITNYVTVNDCANITLAVGASPIMSDAIEEVQEIVTISGALVLNIGTLNDRTISSMLAAGKKANELHIPVVLDPVGAGASSLRNQTVSKLIEQIHFNVIRGNLSEIRYVAGLGGTTKGVDASETDLSGSIQSGISTAKTLANKLRCVIAITGATDIISNGEHTALIENGDKMLSVVTGTGCMCSSLIGSSCAATSDYFLAAVSGVLYMGIAGEIAFENAGQGGNGSFHISIIDEISKLDADTIRRRAKIYEA